ncbi:MAG TPA: transcriptional regulator [Geobacteraceae bacterium]
MTRKEKAKEATVPPDQPDTVRHAIVLLLEGEPVGAREISQSVRIPEREVYLHLEHIRKSARHDGRHLVITPAVCRSCGYLFSKRDRTTRPGKCPLCHHQTIEPPLFSLRA